MERKLAGAMPLLRSAQELHLLIVDSPDDVHDEEPGADMAAYLTHHGARVEPQRLDSAGRPVAEVIKEQALRNQADLIVFGAYSRSRISAVSPGLCCRTRRCSFRTDAVSLYSASPRRWPDTARQPPQRRQTLDSAKWYLPCHGVTGT